MSRSTQRLILGGRVVFGLLYATCLALAGLHAMAAASTDGPARRALFWLGVAGLAAGHLVFMQVVADRVVRVHHRGAIDAVELGLAGLMIVALGLGSAVWFSGATA